ncbi:MAG: hypothetical protein J3K34DRAFT_410208 [Monoraphidium minutum]|nr:MAG: hypothetical protein J3K34DRAFT_410208 [Monoraphidium minutum]
MTSALSRFSRSYRASASRSCSRYRPPTSAAVSAPVPRKGAASRRGSGIWRQFALSDSIMGLRTSTSILTPRPLLRSGGLMERACAANLADASPHDAPNASHQGRAAAAAADEAAAAARADASEGVAPAPPVPGPGGPGSAGVEGLPAWTTQLGICCPLCPPPGIGVGIIGSKHRASGVSTAPVCC